MASSWEDLELNDHQLASLSLAAQPPPPPPPRDSPPAQQPSDDQATPEAQRSGESDIPDVDQALTDALIDPRGRINVLRLDAEVERFCLDDSRQQHVFSADLTPYQRMLAHRVAQHYGMQTSVEVVDAEQPQGQVIARKAASTILPTVKLPIIGAPAARDCDNYDEKKSVRLMRRTGSEERRISKMGSSGQLTDEESLARSVAQREEEYNRARQRIFSSGNLEATGSEVDTPESGVGNDQQQQQQQMKGAFDVQSPSLGSVGSPIEDPHTSSERDADAALRGGGRVQQNSRGAVPGRNIGGRGATGDDSNTPSGSGRGKTRSGGKGGKAVFRDKDKDAQDPDFRRGRARFEPRFDSGYGMNTGVRGHPGQQQGGLYVMPSYGAEFPSLGSPGAGSMPGGMPLPRPPPPPPPPSAGGAALPPGMPPGWPGAPMPLSLSPYGPPGMPPQFPHGMPMPPAQYGMPPQGGGMYPPPYGRMPMHLPPHYGFVPGPGGMPADAHQMYGSYGHGAPVGAPPSKDQQQR